jgi:hypothetical protein
MLADRELLAQLEGCFAPGEIETLIDDTALPGCGARGRREVTLRHRPSGTQVRSDAHDTQLRNKLAALAQLLAQLIAVR